MKTEAFVKESYQEQKERILQELEDVVQALSLEKGIIETQKRVKVHKSMQICKSANNVCTLHFNCGGGIYFSVTKTNYTRERILLSCKKNKFQLEVENDALDVQHLKFLKKLHPKTFPEHLRNAGRKFLLES